jgi:hypothetical protein
LRKRYFELNFKSIKKVNKLIKKIKIKIKKKKINIYFDFLCNYFY